MGHSQSKRKRKLSDLPEAPGGPTNSPIKHVPSPTSIASVPPLRSQQEYIHAHTSHESTSHPHYQLHPIIIQRLHHHYQQQQRYFDEMRRILYPRSHFITSSHSIKSTPTSTSTSSQAVAALLMVSHTSTPLADIESDDEYQPGMSSLRRRARTSASSSLSHSHSYSHSLSVHPINPALIDVKPHSRTKSTSSSYATAAAAIAASAQMVKGETEHIKDYFLPPQFIPYLTHIPTVLFLHICSYLTLYDTLSLHHISRWMFYTTSHGDIAMHIWKRLYRDQTQWNIAIADTPVTIGGKSSYSLVHYTPSSPPTSTCCWYALCLWRGSSTHEQQARRQIQRRRIEDEITMLEEQCDTALIHVYHQYDRILRALSIGADVVMVVALLILWKLGIWYMITSIILSPSHLINIIYHYYCSSTYCEHTHVMHTDTTTSNTFICTLFHFITTCIAIIMHVLLLPLIPLAIAIRQWCHPRVMDRLGLTTHRARRDRSIFDIRNSYRSRIAALHRELETFDSISRKTGATSRDCCIQ